MKTLKSKIDPEIFPVDQDPEITPEDTPENFEIAFTQKEIDLLAGLIDQDQSSHIWYSKISRIISLCRSIAHQVRSYSQGDPEHIPKKRTRNREMSYYNEKFTTGSPFV